MQHGHFEEGKRLFNEIKEGKYRFIPKVSSPIFRLMMNGYISCGSLQTAEQFLIEICEYCHSKRLTVEIPLLNSLLLGYISQKKISAAEQLFCDIFKGKYEKTLLNGTTVLLLLQGYIENGLVSCARKLFDETVSGKYGQKGMIHPHLVSKMIDGYLTNGQVEEAQSLFDNMEKGLYGTHSRIHKNEIFRQFVEAYTVRGERSQLEKMTKFLQK